MAAWSRVREALLLYRKDITMAITRRHALRSVPAFALTGGSFLIHQRAMAQDAATPEATPVGTPVAGDSQALLDLLLEAFIETSLFPADTGMVRPRPWVDEGDTDLIGTVGGVLMQTGQDENGNFIGPGVYIVFPDETAAQTRFDEQRAEADDGFEGIRAEVTEIDLAGYPGFTVREPDNTYTEVVVGPVIVVGPGDRRQPGDPSLRSLVNCAALLDHLLTVMT